jgi:hypothetical protein
VSLLNSSGTVVSAGNFVAGSVNLAIDPLLLPSGTEQLFTLVYNFSNTAPAGTYTGSVIGISGTNPYGGQIIGAGGASGVTVTVALPLINVSPWVGMAGPVTVSPGASNVAVMGFGLMSTQSDTIVNSIAVTGITTGNLSGITSVDLLNSSGSTISTSTFSSGTVNLTVSPILFQSGVTQFFTLNYNFSNTASPGTYTGIISGITGTDQYGGALGGVTGSTSGVTITVP